MGGERRGSFFVAVKQQDVSICQAPDHCRATAQPALVQLHGFGGFAVGELGLPNVKIGSPGMTVWHLFEALQEAEGAVWHL